MKKIITLLTLVPCVILISACSNMEGFTYHDNYSNWNEYNFENANVNAILAPGETGSQRNYQTPKKYYVTAQDEKQYHDMNQRIQKNKEKAQVNNALDSSGNLTGYSTEQSATLPATTVPIPDNNAH